MAGSGALRFAPLLTSSVSMSRSSSSSPSLSWPSASCAAAGEAAVNQSACARAAAARGAVPGAGQPASPLGVGARTCTHHVLAQRAVRSAERVDIDAVQLAQLAPKAVQLRAGGGGRADGRVFLAAGRGGAGGEKLG